MPEIRKIVVGPDFKNGYALAMDQPVIKNREQGSIDYGNYTQKIARIEYVGKKRYEVWIVALNGSNEHKLWRTFEDVPVSIEYNVNY